MESTTHRLRPRRDRPQVSASIPFTHISKTHRQSSLAWHILEAQEMVVSFLLPFPLELNKNIKTMTF